MNRPMKIGAIRGVITAICCFTPILVYVLGLVGLSAALVWLDFVLLPLLAIFIVMLGVGIWQMKSN